MRSPLRLAGASAAADRRSANASDSGSRLSARFAPLCGGGQLFSRLLLWLFSCDQRRFYQRLGTRGTAASCAAGRQVCPLRLDRGK